MPLVIEPEKCRVCGCTELNPCKLGDIEGDGSYECCTWLDFDHTLCTNPKCIAAVPLSELLEMPILRGAIT